MSQTDAMVTGELSVVSTALHHDQRGDALHRPCIMIVYEDANGDLILRPAEEQGVVHALQIRIRAATGQDRQWNHSEHSHLMFPISNVAPNLNL